MRIEIKVGLHRLLNTLLRFFVSSFYYKKKLTAWGPCVSRVAFASQAFPFIVRDADSLVSAGKVFWFTFTLLSYTIRKRRAVSLKCNGWKVVLLSSANSSFWSFILKQETVILTLPRSSGDVIWRTRMKNFNTVSHNRARPYFGIQHDRGEVRACRVYLNVHSVTGNVVDTGWSVEFWRCKCCREFGNNT